MAIAMYSGNAQAGWTSADTAPLLFCVPPSGNGTLPGGAKGRTRVTSMTYLDGGTAHTITCMRAIGRTTVVGAFAALPASAAVAITIAYDPGLAYSTSSQPGQYGLGRIKSAGIAAVTVAGIASGDFVALREKDGVTRVYKCSTVSQGPPLTVILTSVLGTGLGTAGDGLIAGTIGGEDLWFFGLTTDVDPRMGQPHPHYLSGAGTANVTFGAGVVAAGATECPESIVSSVGYDEPILISSNNATAAGTIVQVAWGYSLN